MKNILILGGTGRLGTILTAKLKDYNVTTLSRRASESGQHIQADINTFSDYHGFDTVIHCAAMKDTVKCESQIMECVNTNINATAHALAAAQACGVQKYIYISTDMAVEPQSVYGASKKIADAMVIEAARGKTMQTAVIRFGNIITSSGSILTVLASKAEELGYVPVTDPSMTRFMLSVSECSDLVVMVARREDLDGAVFVPRCKSYRILDVAEAVAPGVPVQIVGFRPGDMLSVKMISSSESTRTMEFEQFYKIMPIWNFQPQRGFCELTSANNEEFVTVQELRALYESQRN